MIDDGDARPGAPGSPDEVPPARAVSGRAVSGRAVSGRAVSGRTVSGRTVSGRTVSGRTVSGHTAPGGAAPDEAVPDEASSGRAEPHRAKQAEVPSRRAAPRRPAQAEAIPGGDPSGTDGDIDAHADADTDAARAAHALAAPLRLRILRLCAFDARTNKELAALLDLNPGTALYHVRILVTAGMLEALPARTGTRGAREIPYRATGRSWHTSIPGQSAVLLETMRQQLVGVDPEAIEATWLGLRLDAAGLDELRERLYALATEFKERGPVPGGDAYSLVYVLHPDLNP